MRQPYLECGKLGAPHGVRGMLRARSFCDTPAVLASLGTVYLAEGEDNYRPVRVLRAAVHGDEVLLLLEGVCDREAAARLRGQTLYAARQDIPCPAGAVLLADLAGLPIIDADSGETLGTIVEALPGAASDLYTVRTPRGDVLFPGVPEFVKEIDTERGVFVRPIPGMFDEI